MGDPFTSQSAPATYNQSPPSDDGSQTAANQLNWSKHIGKIGNPLKSFIESLNSAVSTAFGKIVGGAGVSSQGTSYTVVEGDQGKLVVATAAITVTTPTAATVGSPFVFGVLNQAGADITIDGAGSETVDGEATITLQDNEGVLLYTDGTNWFTVGRGLQTVPTSAMPDGSVVQMVNAGTTAVATGTTAIPWDDTVPQNTEGTEFMSDAITPNATTNLLRIDVVVVVSHSAGTSNAITVALFQDSTANALAATSMEAPGGDEVVTITLTHWMTAGTTSETTFKVRVGGNTGSTVTLNGSAGARKLGGVSASSITTTEIKAS